MGLLDFLKKRAITKEPEKYMEQGKKNTESVVPAQHCQDVQPEGYPQNRRSAANNPANLARNADPTPPEKLQTVYFRNGAMYKILYGSKDNWYDARYLVSDGILYDLESTNDIQSIPNPDFSNLNFTAEGYGVTGSLDYVMRMKAGNLRNKGMIAESDECYKKAIDLMFCSGIPYDIKPYLYFAKDLLREGRFEESEREESRIYNLYWKNLSESLPSYVDAVRENSQSSRPYITQEDREYYRIKYVLPEHAPKSISGYTRMKNAKSANFMKLAKIAKENGIEIILSD